MWSRFHHRKRFFLIIPSIIGMIALFGLIFLYLWNWLMPALFRLPDITYLQGLGILLLSKIIFSGVGHRRTFGPRRYRKDFYKDRCEDNREEKN
jgi:hypothetical protein